MHLIGKRTATFLSAIAASGAFAALSATTAGAATKVEVPLQVMTFKATGVGSSSAKLSGAIATGGEGVLYTFEYGTVTPKALKATPLGLIAPGTKTDVVSATVHNLIPGAIYYYWLVAEPAKSYNIGAYYSAPGKGYPVRFDTAPQITLVKSKLTVKHGRVGVRFACRSASGRCTGSFSASARSHRKQVSLFSGRINIRNGKQATVTVKLTRGGRALLRRARHHRLKATLRITPSGFSSLSRTITLQG
jgi:hypothetical protein